MFLDGYQMNSLAPVGLGKDKGCILGRVLDELLGSHWFWKDIGCVLGRALDEHLGCLVLGNDIGCVFVRILDLLQGSH